MKRTIKKAVRFLFICAVFACMVRSASAQSPNDGFNPNADSTIQSVLVQSDGKILVGGLFTTIGGVTRNRIARLTSAGGLDNAFNPNANGTVYAFAQQTDSKILAGGAFTTISGVTRNRIVRLTSAGNLDTTFKPALNSEVRTIAVQSNGQIIIGGTFTNISTTSKVQRNRIARLNSDGSLDTGFVDPNANAFVQTIALQPDGKILVGGLFSNIGGGNRSYIARLNSDGTLDPSFVSGLSGGMVWSIAVQPDGKIIIGGEFSVTGGSATRYKIARLNSDGSLDATFEADAGNSVYVVAVQPDGKVLAGGWFATMNGVVRNKIVRLNSDGSLDTTFDPNANDYVNTIAVQSDGKIIIGGGFTTVGGVTRNRIARLNSDGSLEVTADPNITGSVFALAVQPDGKMLIGGGFTHVGGVSRGNIARLNSDSTLDAGFVPSLDNGVYSLAVQPDGKILIGGNFTMIGGVIRNHIARLTSTGALDTTFNPNANANVSQIVVQPDGKILIAGSFTKVGGVTRNHIARLTSTGALDTTFNPDADANVYALVLQPDGKIIIGGQFQLIGGARHDFIARLNSDGSVDTAFNRIVNEFVYGIALQPDGKVLIAGNFTMVDPFSSKVTRNHIARLNSDGTLDMAFDPNVDNAIYSLVLQADSTILISGDFTTVSGTARNYVARLNSDGSLDTSFDPSADSAVYAIAAQSDGKIIIGGYNFTTVGGVTRNRFARLSNTGAALQELSVTTGAVSTIQWMRSGTGPEFSRVWFDQSADGLTWTFVGNATRISGGWELAGAGLQTGAIVYVRGRGIAPGGYQNASSSIIEAIKVFDIPAVQKEDSSIITINNDDDTTSKTAVTLTLDKPGAGNMRFMVNTTTWTAWGPYATIKTITLPTGDGVKTVYVQFDNDLANVYYDTIILDAKVPVGTIVIDNGAYATLDLTVDLTLAIADDSAIADMCISPTATCPNLTAGYDWEPFNTAKTFTIPGLATAYGTKTVYAKFRDRGGKVSASVSDTIMYVNAAPAAFLVGYFTINDSAYTTKTAVTLNITAPGVPFAGLRAAIAPNYTQMQFSANGTTWPTTWEAIKGTRAYTLPAGDGVKTVYARFKDAGNFISQVYGDTIILDTKPPVGTILINNGAATTNSRNVTLQLEATDINGVSKMCFSTNGTTWSAWETYATTKNVTLPAGDGTKKVSVKFKDNADKVSVIYYDSIILDTKAPVGKVTINAGAAMTSSHDVKLTLAAPTAVFMLISLDGGVTWGDWEPFVLSKAVTLPAGAGTKTVKVLFSDYTGNVSAVASDTITATVP